MAKAISQSKLLAKLGEAGKKGFTAHKGDETTFSGGGDLPAGIEGGVARLSECGFKQIAAGKQNAGEFMFWAVGIVVAPKTFQGLHVEGGRTTVMETMCATPKAQGRKTVEEHLAWVLNELRKLGVDTTGMELTDLESTCKALAESQPYFKFRTWKGEPTKAYPNPRTNHQWGGVIENYEPSEGGAEAAVEDGTAGEGEEAGEAAEGEEGGEEGVDYAALGEAADGGDQEAAATLTDAAKEAGWTDDNLSSVSSWSEVATALAEGAGPPEGGDEGAEAGGEEWEPEKGQVYKFKPQVKGPGGKMVAGKKEVECEVTAVDKAKKTVALKSMADGGKTKYPGVKWDSLIVIES